MSAPKAVADFKRCENALADPMGERIWLMKQLGANFTQIAKAVDLSTFTVRKHFYRRASAVRSYAMLAARAARHD